MFHIIINLIDNFNRKIMNKQNNQLFTNKLISSKFPNLCPKHQKPIGNNFCVQCLSYCLCSTCIIQGHASHQVLGFENIEQCRFQTRQILLQTLEETLKCLKRKQNEVKNRSAQIGLIKDSLKKLLAQTLRQISQIFKFLQQKISQSINTQEKNLDKLVEKFYQQYNQVNDQLREHLMDIMNCDINVCQFNKQMIIQNGPLSPNFDQNKDTLQKFKSTLRHVLTQINTAKQILFNPSLTGKKNKSLPMGEKIDRYLENSRANQKVNQSFMRTLTLIGKQNAPSLNLELRNRKNC